MALQHLRSSTANKRPAPGSMSDGQLAINTNDGSPGLFFKDSNGALVKIGPVHVGTTAPNASPASGGATGNTKGEQWLDTSGTNPVLKIWDGSAWQSEAGEFVNASGDTMTGNLTAPAFIPNGSTVPTNGVYLPSANTVGISTNGSQRLNIDANGRLNVAANSQGIRFGTQANISAAEGAELILNNLGAQPIAFYTNSTERLRITSDGKVGLGTSLPLSILNVVDANVSGTDNIGNVYIRTTDAQAADVGGKLTLGGYYNTTSHFAFAGFAGRKENSTNNNVAGYLQFLTSTSGGTLRETMRLDSSGRLGVGTTSPTTNLQVYSPVGCTVEAGCRATSGNDVGRLMASYLGGAGGTTSVVDLRAGDGYAYLVASTNNPLLFGTNSTERARIDSSGRLLVGTSSTSVACRALFQGHSSDASSGTFVYLTRGDSSPADGSGLGSINFADSSHTTSASIATNRDGGTWSGSSKPTRLVFSTTADGASSPTERMRISANGAVRIPFIYTDTTASAANVVVLSDGYLLRSTSSAKYKTNVETLADQFADAILGCRPVWYKSLCNKDNPDWGYWGFIAEEVAQIDPRLCFFREEEDGTLEPEGVQYDRFVPHLLNLIKRQKEQIEALEARLTAAGI